MGETDWDQVQVQVSEGVDCGQTRKLCEKQEIKKKYFKRKVVIIFTVQSVTLYQYPVDLLNFLKLYMF